MFLTISQEEIYRIEESTSVQGFIFFPLCMGCDYDDPTSFLNELVKSFTQMFWDGESHEAKQTPVKARGPSINIQQGILWYQLNTGQRPKLPLVRCVNFQVYVKRSPLGRESPSTLGVGPSFSSCNLDGLRRPYLSIRWPRLPRDTQSLAFLSGVPALLPTAWKDGMSSNPAGSHHSPSRHVKSLCSLYNQKASVLRGVSPPGKSGQQVIFNLLAKHFGSERHNGATARFPDIPKSKGARTKSHSCEEK